MTKFKDLKDGEVLSETQFYKVTKKAGNKVQLVNDLGENIVVDDKYVESCLTSANQFKSTSSVNKTDMANLFISNPGVAMTVNFNKQVKETDVVAELMKAYETSTPSTISSVFKKTVKRALEGEERSMVGRHFGEMSELGRVQFVDMEAPKATSGYDARLRQVDPRTINWLIVKGVKYTVK